MIHQGDALKAPFPWFGGKSRVAPEVWSALGDVDNYVEPFAGSLAVLLMRPRNHDAKAETVNDRDAFLCNFWRAVTLAPEEVSKWADWPVNETDLFARHLWLVREGPARLAKLEADPDFFDAKVAGWWVWGINSWIGSGWCSGEGPWTLDESQRPHLGNAGQGVNRKLPHLGDAGRGVNRQLPHLGNRGNDKPGREESLEDLTNYFLALKTRLRRVRVCCGDWARVVTNGALAYGDSVGVFLDPPYSGDVRDKNLYRIDDHDVAVEVRDWAIQNGENKRNRIVLAGYEDEHAAKMPDTWTVKAYSANRCYGSSGNAESANTKNRHKERLWFSPGCLGAWLFDSIPDKSLGASCESAP